MSERDITEVIDRVVAVIPEGEHEAMRGELRALRETALFTAPEIMVQIWRRLSRSLEGNIGAPTEPWHFEVQKIMKGEASP